MLATHRYRSGFPKGAGELMTAGTGAKRLLTTFRRSYRSCRQSLRSCSITFSNGEFRNGGSELSTARTGAKRLLTTSIRSYRSCRQSLRSCSITFTIAVLLICSGCTVQNKQPNNSSTSDEVFSSSPPFKTIEPERYQAIRVVTFTASDGAREVTRTLIAKDGLARREEILGTRSVVYLHLANGMFILVPNARIYSDSNPVTESTPASTPLDEVPEPLLHEGGAETFYRQLGHEDVNGRRLQRYQVVNGSTSPNVTNTETVVWVDEELGMPVKTEVKSGNGNTTIIEITDVKREIDKKFFQIPEDYRKVSREEIQQALRQK